MSLPSGWIANFAPAERSYPQYTTDPTANWEGGLIGHQPSTDNNPAGDIGSIPVMSIGQAAAERLGL